jgi:L-aminopeptidase/D-esterase-like protein
MGEAAQHTTIGVVATDAKLSKTQTSKVAQMAHDGVARAIHPAHTMFDGDTIFALATGELLEVRSRTPRERAELLSLLGSVAADACSRAIIHAILAAETVGQYISYRDKYTEAFL